MDEVNKNLFNKVYDKTFREQLQQEPKQYAKELLGNAYDENMEYSISISTKDKIHIVLPYQNDVSDINLADVVAAGTTSTAASVSSAGSAGTACTTFSSAGTAGSLGTAGTAG